MKELESPLHTHLNPVHKLRTPIFTHSTPVVGNVPSEPLFVLYCVGSLLRRLLYERVKVLTVEGSVGPNQSI